MPIDSPLSGTTPLLLFLAKATLLLLLAFVATSSLRRSTAGARHLVWLATLVAMLALPFLSHLPRLQLEVLPSELAQPATTPRFDVIPVARQIVRGVTPAPSAAGHREQHAAAHRGAPTPAPESSSSATSWQYPVLAVVAILWAGVALCLVGWLASGALTVRRIIRGARELSTPDWTTPLCEVADRLDLEVVPRLLASDRVEMAFACGALTPTIVLPASSAEWTDDRRRAVLLHELAHVRRHDLVGHTLGRIACALYWFHPLVWSAAKQLRAESERACDDLVLSCGARPSEYAQHLLDMVTNVRDHGAPAMVLPMARRKEFEGRMLAILDPRIRRAAPARWQALTMFAGLGVLSLTIAAAAPARARTEQAKPDQRPVSQVDSTPKVQPTPPSAPKTNAVLSDVPAAQPLTPAPQPAQPAQQLRLPQPSLRIAPATQEDTGRVALLIRILKTDKSDEVRKTAAWGLNNVHTEGVRNALIQALRSDDNYEVREMCAWALAEYQTADVANVLTDALRKDKNEEVRETAAWALGNLRGPIDTGALEAALSDQSHEVRHTATWAIVQHRPRTVPRAIIDELKDTDSDVRLVAAWAVSEIGDTTAARALADAFKTETNGEVKTAQLRGLAMMGAVNSAIIEEALKSTDNDLRRHAVSMLAGRGAGVWPWPWPQPRPRPSP